MTSSFRRGKSKEQRWAEAHLTPEEKGKRLLDDAHELIGFGVVIAVVGLVVLFFSLLGK